MHQVRRLYTQFIPAEYQLDLSPDKQSMSFKGTVTINGRKTGRPSRRITLHAKELSVDKVTVTLMDRSGERIIPITRVIVHKSYDELRLHADELLYPGQYRIEISYHGNITKPMSGLYPCFYKDKNDQQQIILATQFESHHAREVFPCIDEPEAKAVFKVALDSPADEVVLANTLPLEQETKDGLTHTVFEPTPKMSTYLLAFIIGKLEKLETTTSNGVKVSTYAQPSLSPATAFALDVAKRCLEFYDDYFGIDYPLPKCDFIALPDFASGAMENWGLITFREQALIVDQHETSLGMKQYVANVVAHELTHQWFGNLVTMRWWNDLWLNESFATLMSYLAVDNLFPEWRVWDQFIVEEQGPALKLDSLEHTHPIQVEIFHPDEIRTIFDNISYEKGASVLFMLMRYLGKEPFKEGLRTYLKRHSYNNTISKDLWDAWEEAAGKPIASFMEAWTSQAGYPLIKVASSGQQLSLTQERFYLNPLATKTETVWPIPLFSQPELSVENLSKAEQKVDLPADNPLIINQGRAAFARVVYDSTMLSQLAEAVSEGKLSELDRQGLLSDSFESAKAGYQTVIESLKLLPSFTEEDSVVVWDIIATNIGSIKGVMDDEDLRMAMNPFIHRLIKKQYDRLGWDEKTSDSHFDKLLRPLIIGMACSSDYQPALEEADQRFAGREKTSILPDLRGVVYTTIARKGGEAEYDALLKMHNESNNSEERLSLAAGLTNFKQPVLIERALAEITTPTVRLQDVAYWVSYSFGNRFAKELTWQWLKQHWQWLSDNLGSDLSFYMMPRYAARAFSNADFIPEFRAFFTEHISPSMVRPLNQAIESISWQSAWRERDHSSLKQFFAEAD